MRVVNRARHATLVFTAVFPLAASSQAATLDDCADIADDGKRLECFDRLAAEHRAQKDAQDAQAAGNAPAQSSPSAGSAAAPAAPARGTGGASFLAEHWELEPGTKHGTFNFRQHEPNYLLITYNTSPNNDPYRPFRRLLPGAGDLSREELVFQLGFKMKLSENPFGMPVDLWFGYTQKSFWQAGNREASSPFRETNYRPELMAVLPVDFRLLGMHARFVNLGLVHESNGQASTLSRSWNRAYAQLGLENGGFTLLARAWHRFRESAADDDNPDIVDYMGHGDLVGTYRWHGHEFSALARYNFQTHRGAGQLGWAFPITNGLKGYVQLFSGYGQSLIDYNHAQNTLGLGVMVSY